MKKDKPPFVMYLAIIYLMIMATVSTMVAIYAVKAEIPSAVEYTVDPIAKNVFCPGTTVKVEYNITVERAPVVIRQVESFWDAANNTTVKAGRITTSYIYEKTGTYRESLTFTVPDFPSGHYEYRLGSGSSSPSATRYMTISFIVTENCN